MTLHCVMNATNECNNCIKCKSVVNKDGTVGMKRWQDLDVRKVYDLLAKLLSEDKDYQIKFTTKKKEGE